ncbi:hypothetical protein NQZ79_g4857 [Umbelopsis isabellina]|nr:hypothetical protein NQZ79_g4857 [Umbelopsis isabellina]
MADHGSVRNVTYQNMTDLITAEPVKNVYSRWIIYSSLYCIVIFSTALPETIRVWNSPMTLNLAARVRLSLLAYQAPLSQDAQFSAITGVICAAVGHPTDFPANFQK